MHRKKLIANLLKIVIGVSCFAIVYFKLRTEFSAEKLKILSDTALSWRGFLCIVFCLLLIPLNWGIESFKWMLITAPVEKLSYKNASKSVYSGVCLGNLAPGRATEFVAKILFFKIENRAKITALHFLNGMFQLSITIFAGLIALLFRVQSFAETSMWMIYLTSAIGFFIIFALVISIYRLDWILNFVTRKINKEKGLEDFHYRFTPTLVLQLFGFSLLRYAVFFFQYILIIWMLHASSLPSSVYMSMALFFLITTTIPMFSIIEAAVRAAIALVVFKDAGISNTALALSSVMMWLINIIFPSVLGYYFLLKQQFNFRFLNKKP
ncbi:MAG: hypothetical protein WCR21_07355 [Bacteroidota bacterium]